LVSTECDQSGNIEKTAELRLALPVNGTIIDSDDGCWTIVIGKDAMRQPLLALMKRKEER
jgi:hypothetical protein